MKDYHSLTDGGVTDCRKSGLALSTLLLVVSAICFLKGKRPVYVPGAAVVIALMAWFRIGVFCRLLGVLVRFGNRMHTVTNPVLLAVIYLAAVVPTALVLRVLSKDILRLRLHPGAATYWLARQDTDWKKSFRQQA